MLFRALSLAAILAALTSTAEAQRCPQQIEVGGTSNNLTRWEVVATSPLMIRQRVNNEEESYTGPELHQQADYYNEKVSNCSRGVPGWCQSNTVNEQRAVAKFLACHLASPGSGKDSEQDIDIITPPVPGCPKYLKKSNIQWSRVGNSQLNIWEVRNVSAKTVKFTYRESGVNSSPDTLPPGQSTQVSTQSSTVPPYVVRDFQEMKSFERRNPQQKSLQCTLSIRPQ